MNRYFAMILSAVLLASACEKMETGHVNNEIAVCANVSNLVTASTKADSNTYPDPNYTVYTLTSPTTETPLLAAIWASSVPGKYTGAQSGGSATYKENGYVDYHNTTRFTGSARQLLDHQLFYPDNDAKGDIYGNDPAKSDTLLKNSPVYFVGLCPRSGGWSVASYKGTDNCAVYNFTGKDDVMFAPEAHKSIATTDPVPTLTFHHLLTQIHINVNAYDDRSIEPWGTIHRIRIESRDKITINTKKTISDGINPDANAENTGWLASFSYSKDDSDSDSDKALLPTYKFIDGKTYPTVEFDDSAKGSDGKAITSGVDLTVENQEVAFVLCAPVNADGNTGTEYTLVMDIGNRQGVQVPFSVKDANGAEFSGSTAGCQFDVFLTFKAGEKISTYATVTSWENDGAVVQPVTE